jgi:acyl-CoA synthetase (AMP-forming)/AMP-acid ligase II/acyl carrier protein/dienelactone hydrolase
LIKLVSKILKSQVDPGKPFVAQGLDSLGAAELLEELQLMGFDVDYEFLLAEANIERLIHNLREFSRDFPKNSCRRDPVAPVALSGPQVLWSQLDSEGWGNWANISLCLSIPASLIRAPFLPAVAQLLCDANDAMRMVLVQPDAPGSIVRQRVLPDFQIPVEIAEAPSSEREAMRLISAFEGRECSPFTPSTRALVLSSPDLEGRHWLCITMHHVFSDRISMHILTQQARDMIEANHLHVEYTEGLQFSDISVWKNRRGTNDEGKHSAEALAALLTRANVSADRPVPRVANPDWKTIGNLEQRAELQASETLALERYAGRLGTTLPLLIHSVASILIAHLTRDENAMSGDADMLLCHVVSNRERDPVLKEVVGCLDTSVPVAVRLQPTDTLSSLCQKTHQAFSQAHPCVADLPRGSWIVPGGDSSAKDAPARALFERFAHVNIVRSLASGTRRHPTDIQEHTVERPQQARWGLLLRVKLPPKTGPGEDAKSMEGTVFRAFAEDRELAALVPYCLVEVLRGLLSEPEDRVLQLSPLGLIAQMIDRLDMAALQVRLASERVEKKSARGEPFIYERLVARQKRWYQHDKQFQLCRDAKNRFIGTAANPFPFTQLDKLKERRFLEERDVPLPKLLHVLPKERFAQSLIELAPDLPKSFVIKPVGAGHSFGVTLVKNGLDLSRNGIQFDPERAGRELAELARRGSCQHEGKVFQFNFSSFLIEEFVQDERGFAAPTDYKVFMMGERFLWLQVHFKADAFDWVAFLDADYRLLPQPAWDPAICWRTHRTLVCSDQAIADARRPVCLTRILEHSGRLAREMGLFVRFDWYADQSRGPLMGEITTFPHMLQPRAFYAPWANELVKTHWQEPDGVAPRRPEPDEISDENGAARAIAMLDSDAVPGTGIEAFLSPSEHGNWSTENRITYRDIRKYIAGFDLAHWGVAPGARVGLLVPNGVQLAALLLAVMNRYVAVPLDASLPAAQVAGLVRQQNLCALLCIANTDETRKIHDAARHLQGLTIISLTTTDGSALAELPSDRSLGSRADPTPANCLEDEVLLLQTSGSSGEPKNVAFTLSRLIRSSAIIGISLDLSQDDLGISMLPMHHVGGISSNLIAPLLTYSGMHHCRAFDPKAFFDHLAGPQGATWCYLVPAMWRMVLDFAGAHPELRETRPWPRLRAIRSAGAELPETMAQDLLDLFGSAVGILPTYGMTEAMPIAAPPTSYRLERPGSVGYILSSTSVEIVDHTDGEGVRPVANGVVGEITVKGPSVFDGYVNSGGKNLDLFTPRGYFRTGDLGYLSADGSGWLWIAGRLKDVINVGGETIPPGTIEDAMRDCPAWADQVCGVELMAFPRIHRELGEDVALAVVGAPEGTGMSDICSWAAGRLPAMQVPKTLVHVQALPRNGNGKLRRAHFASLFNEQTQQGQTGILETFHWRDSEKSPCLMGSVRAAPGHMIQPPVRAALSLDAILEIVGQHLGSATRVGPDTSFIDAGVNSLAAVELALLLGEQFELDLPTWILSDHPTPRDLYAAMSELQAASPGTLADRTRPTPKATPHTPVAPEPQIRRILFLHGEGADSDLMEKSLKATHWASRLSGRVEFVFLDAPHVCAPMPAFHSVAVEAGLYKKPTYRSWAVTKPETLRESLAVVRKYMNDMGPVDAIGGICDGALIAALLAMERPDLTMLLCMSPSPVARLKGAWHDRHKPIACRSMHLVSAKDAEHSLAQQLEVAGWCASSLVIQHSHGHAVPRFTSALERDVLGFWDATDSRVPDPASTWRVDTQSEPAPQTKLAVATPDGAAYEATVAKYMARILRQPSIDKGRDFFDAGGDSLKAMVLAMKLEQKLSMDLPYETLFAEGATAKSMARVIDRLRDTNTPGVLSAIGQSVSEREVFALPILNGHHSAYLAIALSLSESARLVGVKPPLLGRGKWRPSATLRDIATQAATIISNHTKHNRIDLVGCSAAGVLALETARVLSARGHEIRCLALIDSGFTSDGSNWPVPVKYFTEWQKHVSRRMRGKTNIRRGYRQLHFRAQLSDWRPEPVKVRSAIFFRADQGTIDERQIDMWRSVIDGDFYVIPIPGPHDGFVIPEIAEEIAREIRTKGLS